MPVVYAVLIVLAAALIWGAYRRARSDDRVAPPPAFSEDTLPWARWRRPRDPS
jgi:hypothetical protein